MTEISSMVSYYSPLMYRQQPSLGHQQAAGLPGQQSPASSMSPGQGSPPGHQQQLLAGGQHQSQQHAAAIAAAAAAAENQQCAWYGYTGHAHAAAAAAAAANHHHHQTANQQYLEHEMPLWTSHPHTYLQYQHHQAYQQQQQQQQQQLQMASGLQQGQLEWSGDEGAGSSSNNNNSAAGVGHHHQQQHPALGAAGSSSSNNNNGGVGAGEPSPPITVSSSEISSPGTPASPATNLNNNLNNNNNNNVNTANNNHTVPMRPGQTRSPYEWMKKPSYQTQPNPGKTRTKDKYRVVYTEHQRLELEKEFYSSKYITIRRKAELATNLALSERQVKIWFQNRRAKERKQSKKRGELEQRDVKPMIDAHGVAHPGHPGGPGAAVGGMAGLALGGMSMSNMLSGLIHGGGGGGGGGSPPLLPGHHHHHHPGAAAAAAHHALLAASQHHAAPQHSVLGI